MLSVDDSIKGKEYKKMKTRYRHSAPKTQSQKTVPPAAPVAPVPGGVVIGKLVGLTDQLEPLVAFDLESTQSPLVALSVVPINEENIGVEVVLSFAGNRDGSPVLMGVVQSRLDVQDIPVEKEDASATEMLNPELLINGEKINISAAKEITLQCGKSSITLNKSGKILIKGEHILSRASGANRVRGGSIQLN